MASRPRDPRSFLDRRGEIYRDELGETAAILLGILVVAAASSTRRGRDLLPAGLILLTFLDLMFLGRHRLVETGPLRPLVEQSPVLARLASEPRGTRVVDGFRNLPMLTGLNPIFAYRTLDLPAMEPLTALAHGPLFRDTMRDSVHKAMRAAGVGLRVLDPTEVAVEGIQSRARKTAEEPETVDDPALAGWLFGPPGSEPGGLVLAVPHRPGRARAARGLVRPLDRRDLPAMLDVWTGDTGPLLDLFDRARPLVADRPSSLRWDVPVDADGDGWVVVSQLADPQWQARWTGRDGQGDRPAEIVPTFRREARREAGRGSRVPGPGRGCLHLEYVAADVTRGLWISALAWPSGLSVLAALAGGRGSGRAGTGRQGIPRLGRSLAPRRRRGRPTGVEPG